MDTHFYYKFLRKTILAFLDIFNDIQIGKYKDGKIVKMVNVPIKFVPKQKFYYWTFNRKHEKRLPMMGAEITSITYDNNRKGEKHGKIQVKEDDTGISYYINPAPYKVEFELSVATEYLTEMEQIASQILPYFDPFVITTIQIDELNDTWNIPITLNNISLDQEAEMGEEDRREVIWSFTFTAETYISKPVGNVDFIKKVIQKVYTSEESWNYVGNTDTESPSGEGNESVEYFTEGYRDDGEILYNYEVFK